MNPKLIQAAKVWLKELQFRDIEPEDIDDLTGAEIVRAIRIHFDGGIAEFMRCMEDSI